MKKIFAVLVLAVCMLSVMTGCGKLEDKVLGTWVVTEDAEIPLQQVNGEVDVEEGETLLVIWEDGSCTLNLHDIGNNEYASSNWSIVNGDELKINYNAPLCFAGTFCYQVKVNGDEMTWGDVHLKKSE